MYDSCGFTKYYFQLQWNGKTCNKDEKFKAVQYLQTIKSERGGKCKVESIDEREISDSHKFYAALKDENAEEDDEEVSMPYDCTNISTCTCVVYFMCLRHFTNTIGWFLNNCVCSFTLNGSMTDLRWKYY